MNNIKAQSRLVCGVFVIVASLSNTGCGTLQTKSSLPEQDLAYFQIDCSKKEEQLKFLQSQRHSADDRMIAGFTNFVLPWEKYISPREYGERQATHTGRSNWIVNQNILRLTHDCP
jgi:hypothetical protein